MKKKLIILLLIVAMLPVKVFAKSFVNDYNTKNFVDTLTAEGMEIENKDYKEDSKQAIIYMFRGDGCSFCRKFLTFLNSISNEYGKYFKLVSFEVWKDAKNKSLINKVSIVTDKQPTGVPYIVIGDEVFSGYSSEDDEKIKATIMAQYNNPSFDLMEELDKKLNGTNSLDTFAVVFWNAFVVVMATVALIVVNNKNTQRIIDAMNEQTLKTGVKKVTKNEESK